MRVKNLGKGDVSSITGDPQDLGLTSREGHDHHAKMRKDTGDMKQQPKGETKQVSSDRGTFPSKC